MAKYNHFTDAKLTSFVKLIKAKVKPMIPTKVSQLDNDSKYLTTHQSLDDYVKTDDARLSDARNAKDVSAWAKAATKPTYSASEVGACTRMESQITVATSAWSDNSATVSVAGVTADNNVHMGYEGSSSNWDICKNAEIRMVSQAAGSITLNCSSTPSGSAKLNFAIYT